ncbi:hypothetical protein M9H77_02796 [Catharanthus roseus]|uniref:Uncharacterized protein n=1 Tax=Catharanthus roseus TaxID=4058 RepID=A0ACC0C9X3_CATRO|nr:hypothetical protein M9H77_02796 [Catharanthus roseus]
MNRHSLPHFIEPSPFSLLPCNNDYPQPQPTSFTDFGNRSISSSLLLSLVFTSPFSLLSLFFLSSPFFAAGAPVLHVCCRNSEFPIRCCQNSDEKSYGARQKLDVKEMYARELHSKKRYPAYDPFFFAYQAKQVSYITYPSTKRQNIDWWAVLKSRPRVFNVPIVEVLFQEDVGIAKTLSVDRKIEYIGPLTHESGVSDMVDLIGGREDDVEEEDDFINNEMEWESEDKDNEEEVGFGDVEVSPVTLDTSTTSAHVPARPGQLVHTDAGVMPIPLITQQQPIRPIVTLGALPPARSNEGPDGFNLNHLNLVSLLHRQGHHRLNLSHRLHRLGYRHLRLSHLFHRSSPLLLVLSHPLLRHRHLLFSLGHPLVGLSVGVRRQKQNKIKLQKSTNRICT